MIKSIFSKTNYAGLGNISRTIKYWTKPTPSVTLSNKLKIRHKQIHSNMYLKEGVTEELVLKIWREFYKDNNLTISNCQLSPVGEPGDYYSSYMTRAVCDITAQDGNFKRSMVIKTLPKGGAVLKYIVDSKAFEKEQTMVDKVLPRMEEILENAGIRTKLAARQIFAQTEPVVFAMEDLAADGFVSTKRYEGLSLEQCFAVMKSLAAYHAASSQYLTEHPTIRDTFARCIWGSHDDKNRLNITSALDTVIENVDSWSATKWSDKLRVRRDDLVPKLYKAIETVKPDRPLVLNHGDLWHCNIMFKPDTVPPQLCFVDFQLVWTNCPIFDILYFIFTSPRADVRFAHMHDIIREYHASFTEVSKTLKLPASYSYQQMIDDFHEFLPFGYLVFQYVLPLAIGAKANKEMTEAKEGEPYMRNNPAYLNPVFQQIFVDGLNYFDNQGFFN